MVRVQPASAGAQRNLPGGCGMNARLKPVAVNGLHWVRGELDQSVTRARSLIEQHLDNPDDPLPLQQAYVELHQVRGTAAMIRCFGAAMLAEEMTARSEEHTSELQSLMRISYAVFCLKKKNQTQHNTPQSIL